MRFAPFGGSIRRVRLPQSRQRSDSNDDPQLRSLFHHKAIALIGASNEPNSVGAVLARNLFESGFRGAIMPVNLHEKAIRSAVNYRSIADLPDIPDLAVIATPSSTVPGIIAELGARGCRAAVVITAGFGEGE